MKILVAGATGVIGRQLVPLLVKVGHEVAGLTRSPSKARILLLPLLAQAVGAKPPFRIPAWIGRFLIGDAIMLMTEVRGASNQKAKQALEVNLKWPSWREGFRGGLASPLPQYEELPLELFPRSPRVPAWLAFCHGP